MVMRRPVFGPAHVRAKEHDPLHSEMNSHVHRALKACAIGHDGMIGGGDPRSDRSEFRIEIGDDAKKTEQARRVHLLIARARHLAASEGKKRRTVPVLEVPTPIREIENVRRRDDFIGGIDDDHATAAKQAQILL